MLKTRIITAVVLLAVLLAALFSGSTAAFVTVAMMFLLAALTESFQLFGSTRKQSAMISAVWCAAFIYAFIYRENPAAITFWFAISSILWLGRFVPTLKVGLPPMQGSRNTVVGSLYAISIIACFAAIVVFFRHSALYLLSVMALVWIADIGAYFSGKAFGKRKLAPSISPGKSWEGAIGGGVAVLLLASLSILSNQPLFADTFAVHLQSQLGWAATFGVLIVLVAASVVGDLFESMLKRRAGVKDSSKLLPGHGGVLDRIDALVPVLPMAALIHSQL